MMMIVVVTINSPNLNERKDDSTARGIQKERKKKKIKQTKEKKTQTKKTNKPINKQT